MATPRNQRIGIWIIAVVMVIGTLGSFAVIVLANQNSSGDQARMTELTNKYQEDTKAYQKKVDKQAKELSKKYFDEFNEYADRPAKFDRDGVEKLKKEDLKEGDGKKLGKDATFTAYYIGWTPDGKTFDSSIDGKELKAPFSVAPGGVIEGWTKGAEGMKVGGVRELTIPSDQAYGEKGSGDKIAPNTPLKFIIMVIPTPKEIPQPEMPEELLKYYSNGMQ